VVDTLLLAATHVDLAAAVAAGTFRADLYYRLAITEICLPRLALRSDFTVLAHRLLADIAPGLKLEDAALARMQAHPWPGNIRELRNVLTRLSLSNTDIIRLGAVDALLPHAAEIPQSGSVLRNVQARQVSDALQECGGNISSAARILGVSRNTIYRAMRAV
jgi:transcriptional regulator of acetoin/glycerol metabolism